MIMWTKKIVFGILLLAAALFVYLAVPNIASEYVITVINGALVLYIAALGISVILGMCGQISFAAPAFMGVGGYASANLCIHLGLPVILAILCAVIISVITAIVIGLILMRLEGTFFAFSTVALVVISYNVFNNWKVVTGGPNGIAAIPAFSLGGLEASTFSDNYIVLITFVILSAVIAIRLGRSTLGRSMNAVRDNEIAAQVMGVKVYQTKVIAFTIAGALAGLAGALMVHNNHFVVSTYFTFDQSITLIIMAMLGGVTSPSGVFLGTILITMLPELLKPIQEYIRLVYGVGVMLLMIFMPMGLWGTLKNLFKKIKTRFNLGKTTMVGRCHADGEGV